MVYKIVSQIPYGRVVSYGDIARMMGVPWCAHQVGWAMRRCPEEIPWQRVVKADGTVAGGLYAEIRKARLKAEGVDFKRDGRVDMEKHRWKPDR